MANSTTARLEDLTDNRQTIIRVAVVMVALLAALALLALVSSSAIDVMTPNTVMDSMVIDASEAVFRP